MHLTQLAAERPDKAAYIMAATGQTFSYLDLEQGSNQLAHLFRSLGLNRGDHIAILLENHPLFLQICVAAQRSGLYFTAISYRLQRDEVAYIVNDCGAKVFITSKDRQSVVEALLADLPDLGQAYMLDGISPGFESLESAIETRPTTPIADRVSARPCCIRRGRPAAQKGYLDNYPKGSGGQRIRLHSFECYMGQRMTVFT